MTILELAMGANCVQVLKKEREVRNRRYHIITENSEGDKHEYRIHGFRTITEMLDVCGIANDEMNWFNGTTIEMPERHKTLQETYPDTNGVHIFIGRNNDEEGTLNSKINIKATATICALCLIPFTNREEITADHIVAGDPTSPLQPAHKSCNSRRGNQAL